MKKQTNLNLAIFAMLIAVAFTFSATSIKAQDDDKNFKVGDKVEFKSGPYSEWLEGTVVSAPLKYSWGTTVVEVRSKPDQYHPDGAVNTYDIQNVRRATAAPSADKNAAVDTGAANPPAAGNNAGRNNENNQTNETQEAGGDKNFKVGDKVEMRRIFTGEYEEGTVVSAPHKESADLTQIEIRSKPDKLHPDGEVRNYDIKNVQRVTVEPPDETGGGVMTKQDIVAWMRANSYANGQPKGDPRICRRLLRLIKRRGVTEPLEYGGNDPAAKMIYENACNNAPNVALAIGDNIGAPNTQNWLYGTWGLFIYSGANTYVNTARGTAVTVDTGANAYSATIKSDGTYVWKVDSRTIIKDTWRTATAEEMGDRGGAGIVLLNGEGGVDWIVYKKFGWKDKADHVEFRQLKSFSRRIGTRK